jgi:hypothetical protein
MNNKHKLYNVFDKHEFNISPKRKRKHDDSII